jgi:hypothetical protein
VNAVARMLRPLLPATALLMLLPAAAFAQETREYDLPELGQEVREERSLGELVKVGLKASNRFVGLADFGDYKANSYQPEFRARVTAPVAKNAGIRLMGTGRVLHYDFIDGRSDLGIGSRSGGPFDDLYNWSVRLQGVYLANGNWTLFSESEQWSLMTDLFTRASWEKGASMSDSFGGGGSLAVGYRLGRTLELAAGVSLRTSPRTGNLKVAPVFEFDWRINDRWKLSSQGLGLRLQRRVGERFTLFTRARLETSSYLLDERGAEIGDAYLRIRQVPVGLGLEWRPTKHLRVTTLGGVMAVHQLEVKDSHGQLVDRDSAKPSPYFLIRFDLKS